MDIRNGFQIDKPSLFIPWNIKEDLFVEIFENNKVTLNHVTEGYYAKSYCESLGGLKHNLGFHFEPRRKGLLKELEFFRSSYIDLDKSFKEFNDYFEKEFGEPKISKIGKDGYPYNEWRLPGSVIYHSIFNRFGPEEHLRIKKK
ncbi:MAG: hypothetical protein AB7S78_10605 [Candidatus Omnitrophota bacterium]